MGSTQKRRESNLSPFIEFELMQLRAHAIALKNLIISVFAHGSDHVLTTGRGMASRILSRPGGKQPLLTALTAAHMCDLIGRFKDFKDD